jgi:hypothetical protein
MRAKNRHGLFTYNADNRPRHRATVNPKVYEFEWFLWDQRKLAVNAATFRREQQQQQHRQRQQTVNN